MLANCKPNQSTKNKLKLNKHHSKIIVLEFGNYLIFYRCI